MSKKLGTLIKEARTTKGLTQAALAEKVEGLTASDVSKIERGEKEPEQNVLKQIAKVLGVTQKSLLEAAAGTGSKPSAAGTSTGKKPSAANTSTAKKTGKTTSSAKKPSAAKTAAEALKLTAAEKKLVQLYRKADTNTKKAAINLLEGDSNAIELMSVLLSSKAGSSAENPAGKDKDAMSALMEMLGKINK